MRVKCPKKINNTCQATWTGCNHAVAHTENQFCKANHACPGCVEFSTNRKSTTSKTA